MTPDQVIGGVGLIFVTLASVALAVIVFQRLAVRLEAWMRARRAVAFGPETASAQEDRAARDLYGGSRRA